MVLVACPDLKLEAGTLKLCEVAPTFGPLLD